MTTPIKRSNRTISVIEIRKPSLAFGSNLTDTIPNMERKIFWTVFILLGLVADFLLPLWWALAATIPIAWIAWWVAYRSDWF